MTDTAPIAVLDVGSNTIRLLVAESIQDGLRPLVDQSEFVRLGTGVDASGLLLGDRIEAGVLAVRQLAEQARARGADRLVAIATSAVRDAGNGREFVERVRAETGVPIEIIDGDREAYLTFLGATLGLKVDGGMIVCDLGGGSTELIHATDHTVHWATSMKLGSGRLSERFMRHDPPLASEVDELQAHVHKALSEVPGADAQTSVFTGGTASTLALLAGLVGSTAVDLPADSFDRVMAMLEGYSAAKVTERFGVNRERARVLPAGVAALEAIATFYNTPRTIITQHGIREGALLDLVHR